MTVQNNNSIDEKANNFDKSLTLDNTISPKTIKIFILVCDILIGILIYTIILVDFSTFHFILWNVLGIIFITLVSKILLNQSKSYVKYSRIEITKDNIRCYCAFKENIMIYRANQIDSINFSIIVKNINTISFSQFVSSKKIKIIMEIEKSSTTDKIEITSFLFTYDIDYVRNYIENISKFLKDSMNYNSKVYDTSKILRN